MVKLHDRVSRYPNIVMGVDRNRLLHDEDYLTAHNNKTQAFASLKNMPTNSFISIQPRKTIKMSSSTKLKWLDENSLSLKQPIKLSSVKSFERSESLNVIDCIKKLTEKLLDFNSFNVRRSLPALKVTANLHRSEWGKDHRNRDFTQLN